MRNFFVIVLQLMCTEGRWEKTFIWKRTIEFRTRCLSCTVIRTYWPSLEWIIVISSEVRQLQILCFSVVCELWYNFQVYKCVFDVILLTKVQCTMKFSRTRGIAVKWHSRPRLNLKYSRRVVRFSKRRQMKYCTGVEKSARGYLRNHKPRAGTGKRKKLRIEECGLARESLLATLKRIKTQITQIKY